MQSRYWSEHRTFLTNDGWSAQLGQVLTSYAVKRLEDGHAEFVLYQYIAASGGDHRVVV